MQCGRLGLAALLSSATLGYAVHKRPAVIIVPLSCYLDDGRPPGVAACSTWYTQSSMYLDLAKTNRPPWQPFVSKYCGRKTIANKILYSMVPDFNL